MPKVLAVNTRCALPPGLGDGRCELPGTRRTPRAGVVALGRLGLVNDAGPVHDAPAPHVHGSVAKAIYAFPSEHYPVWRTLVAQARHATTAGPGALARWGTPGQPGDARPELPWGSMGEDLTLEGVTEMQVWVGDRLRFADCELAVSEPRLPCPTFAAAMGFAHAPRMMAQSGHCGFFLMVVEPGTLAAGEPFELLAGPRQVGIRELFDARMRGRRPD